MACEAPLVTMVVARLADARVNLAAYGSVVFSLSLLIEAPVIMLLAASTALSTDRRSWGLLARFALASGLCCSALHALVAFTPLFDLVVELLIDPPAEVYEPARLGLRIMTPWTLAIAWRRFQQGVLIRAEEPRLVWIGTFVRLVALAVGLALGWRLGLSGIAVGTLGVALGVSCEALFAEAVTRPRVRRLPAEPPAGTEALGWGRLMRFYLPLALTPLITLVVPTLSSRAMSAMPRDLDSLAAWPAVHGLVFTLRSVGLAYNEVVVHLVGEPGGRAVLRRTSWAAATVLAGLLLAAALSPFGAFWFGRVSGLDPELTALASSALVLAVLMPGYQVLQSWYQGTLVRAGVTRPITTSVVLYLAVAQAGLLLGQRTFDSAGILWVVPSLTLAGITQTVWLRLATRRTELDVPPAGQTGRGPNRIASRSGT